MQRPARSQSPKRVGSGPFGPPISRLWLPALARAACGGCRFVGTRPCCRRRCGDRPLTALIRHRQILPETPRLRTTTRLGRAVFRGDPRNEDDSTMPLQLRGARDSVLHRGARHRRCRVPARPVQPRRLSVSMPPLRRSPAGPTRAAESARCSACCRAARSLAARDAARRRGRARQEAAHVRAALARSSSRRADDVAVAALLGERRRVLARARRPQQPTAPNRMVCRDELCFVRVGASYWHALGAPAALRRSRRRCRRRPKRRRRSPRSARAFPRSRRRPRSGSSRRC